MQSYYTYPAESSRRHCSSAPAVPKPRQENWETSQQASSSYASLYEIYDPYSNAPPTQTLASLDMTRGALLDDSSSPMSIYSPLSDSEYPYTPSTGRLEHDMEVLAPSMHTIESASNSQSFAGSVNWPVDAHQWPKDYSNHDLYYEHNPQAGIYVYQDGAYHIVHPAPTDYYQYSSEPSPLSDVTSLWAASQHAPMPSFTLANANSLVPLPASNPDPIPLHQPRPTRRFNYQMMHDMAASLEASVYYQV